MSTTPQEIDHLGLFLKFADSIQSTYERAHRPAYVEACTCGASVEIGREIPAAERRRMYNNFLGRHAHCTEKQAP